MREGLLRRGVLNGDIAEREAFDAVAPRLHARWVAEALDEAAGRLHAQVAEQRGTTWDSLRHAADVVAELAAEYRDGTR